MGVDYRLLGQRMKQKRRQLGRTQDNLAEALGVSVGYVSQLERGVTKINLDTLAAVAGWLGCGIGELVTGVDSARPDYLTEEIAALCRRMDDRQKRLLLAIGADILKNAE
ncbi:MAG TPA: helix-turn-helix transcriptional regulator [Candidatus Merdivicinus excrementipullorum]|uniref:Helix-turn-helix transcriptional regulator n=1 Tax=Candidatus Merdivicinus excrementipullorum TaxID=2840867 RepID=A0A9D1FPP7_9FIRM|nr:helix-turn-helix transcriptional regulator [Candidatus Merdivicinus excrementipullorum]